MNKTVKVLLWVGALLGLCLCGAVVLGLGLDFAYNKLSQAANGQQDPVAVARSIVDYELPPGYAETSATDVVVYQMALISNEDAVDAPTFMLIHYQWFMNVNTRKMVEDMQPTFEQNSGDSATQWTTTDQYQATVNGQTVDVLVMESLSRNGYRSRQLTTSFKGKSGNVLLIVQGGVNSWDEALVQAFMASIH